jgi:hypothetical protein
VRERTRRNLIPIAFGFAILALAAWLAPFESRAMEWVPYVLIALSFLTGAAWKLIIPRRPREEPDVLALHFKHYLEVDGFCFVVYFEVLNGVFWVHVAFQNRFANRCIGRVFVVPMEGAAAPEGGGVPNVTAEIHCEGGEAGVASYPCAIAAEWQGKYMIYDAYAEADYHDGRGEELRSQIGKARGMTFRFHLPTAIATTLPSELAPHARLLWEPEQQAVSE